ncbi:MULTISPECIES: class D sortase [Shouchella]|uniref:Class D sortase n=2 Tax=Shouchella TaxID=2893057 RepID=A0ABY7W3U3_9BACI|nr:MULTISPECIES: class D sortase [Shouchella]MED4130118.1 class D sortase [Shouchella miscanthi]WDF02128.1 class D sortase [Shouchella hunanensis]
MLVWFGYDHYQTKSMQNQSLAEAQERLFVDLGNDHLLDPSNLTMTNKDEPQQRSFLSPSSEQARESFQSIDINQGESFAILEIESLNRQLPIVEGTNPEELQRGVGHYRDSVLPGGNEQILLSGHRDTVFRDFGQLEIGDLFIMHMEYGSFRYKIEETDIVDADDRTVIREMGEEVLVVTTCYPFDFINHAPERFVIYAYPID